MPEKIPLPNRDLAFDLLKDLKVPYQVRRHSLKVAEKALEIASKINNTDLDIDLVEIGALLHDIGRSKTHGFKHALIGGKISNQFQDFFTSQLGFLVVRFTCRIFPRQP